MSRSTICADARGRYYRVTGSSSTSRSGAYRKLRRGSENVGHPDNVDHPGDAPASPQAEHLDQLAAKLQHELQRIAAAAPGVVGIAVVDIGSGKRFGVNEDLIFPQGSAIKIPILIELYRRADRGEVKLTDRLPLGGSDQVGGSGLCSSISPTADPSCRCTTWRWR